MMIKMLETDHETYQVAYTEDGVLVLCGDKSRHFPDKDQARLWLWGRHLENSAQRFDELFVPPETSNSAQIPGDEDMGP